MYILSMTKFLIWRCEKMIHANASIWRCLKSAHKGGNGNNFQAVYREYMKGEEGVWGALAPPPQKPTEC